MSLLVEKYFSLRSRYFSPRRGRFLNLLKFNKDFLKSWGGFLIGRALVGEDGDDAPRAARERDALVLHVGRERHASAADLRGVNGSSRAPRLGRRGRRAGRTTKGCFFAAGG